MLLHTHSYNLNIWLYCTNGDSTIEYYTPLKKDLEGGS